ncbi:hypothetical protein [Chitinophaga sp. RAB17]|uniref:hypothetical protein n=1 Tax=Chitinophaga sp. RAB17 TaxID=3233049 RepID=UPI003F905050
MNIQQYISSGIIEGYLLGLISEEESAELESMCREYPELDMEIQHCQLRMEKMMFDEPALPPAELKNEILNRVKTAPVNEPAASYTFINLQPKNENFITVHRAWRHVFIMVFLLSKIALYIAVFYYFKYRKLEQQLKDVHQTEQVVSVRK